MIAGALVSIIAPKMGRALLAAFLKNSLRDWSSALFLLFFITLEVKNAYELPNSALIVSFWSGNKKDVGVYSSAPIPTFRPSHCLFLRISNASQPTPSDIIAANTTLHLSIIKGVMNGWDIIHSRRRLSCITAVGRFKFAKFECTDR
ncbi:MAG: hypothetical protein K2J96_00995 [Bacteroidaceae bacterium]|nr:hypothetical protein [Bacteroidaceae bacterium]